MLIVTPRYRVSGGVREAPSLPGQCWQRKSSLPYAVGHLIGSWLTGGVAGNDAVLQRQVHRCGCALMGFGCLRWCANIGEKDGAAMAQKIQMLFIDDIDGSEAEGTVRSALDGAGTRST